MRVRNWNPKKYDEKFMEASMGRLRTAAGVIATEIRNRCPVGTISRPMYQKGPYAGQPWTARDAGQLKKSIRVVEKKETWGYELKEHRRRNIRVYVGHFLAYYARIVEYSKPFMRPAWRSALPRAKNVIQFGTQIGRSSRRGESATAYARAKGRAA